ncbi:YdeI/OmpD-associated family protein [Flavihumibacter petaseus]|uniref:Bacteriocin-protection protein n=1 Tax=Flavihumibacter petaseus NBRC 106054 TaxID=1220578 RepID=A0A0E9N2M6_9BACT|nr:YdeI/OmpD-associated family protein [Flavihumibacter petaseus]GAO44053.1 hypothetical protein FPE01S_03_00930 [Flavihumibacter petaseus NBRC 106054]
MTATPVFHPTSVASWRKWLEKNHQIHKAVWLVCYTKNAKKKSISWSDAVDVALCFGWIDSKKIKIDEETSHQFFSQRKKNSTWSRINKNKVERLIESGRMAEAGLKSIEIARQNGSWNLLDAVENLTIPEDLEKAFRQHKGTKQYFLTLSKSLKKMLLQWLVLAKRPETRQKRIDEIVAEAIQQKVPKPFSRTRNI